VARIERDDMHVGFWWESQKERDHYEGFDVGGRIILRRILGEIEWGDMNWISLDQDGNKWRALVNAVMNIPVQ
jgi:hypothetical protein